MIRLNFTASNVYDNYVNEGFTDSTWGDLQVFEFRQAEEK